MPTVGYRFIPCLQPTIWLFLGLMIWMLPRGYQLLKPGAFKMKNTACRADKGRKQ